MAKAGPSISILVLGVISIFCSFSLTAQSNTFYSPAKGKKSIFVNVDGSRAYIFEIYRLPEGGGFTGRKVIDTLNKTANGNYAGKVSELTMNDGPKKLKIKYDYNEAESLIELDESEDHNAYNGSLNNALLNQFAFRFEKEIREKYPDAEFSSIDVIDRFYSGEEVYLPYKEYESKYSTQFIAYSDSVNKELAGYAAIAGKLRQELITVSPADFKAGIDRFPGENGLKVPYFKELTNELAMTSPVTYFKVAELSTEEERNEMFGKLTRESRRNLIENGPDCEMKTLLKKQHNKKVWKDVGLIGVPSALIIVGAATIHTE